MTTPSTTKAIPEMSAEARILITSLRSLPEAGFISYADLSHACGHDVRSPRGRGYLTTAARHLLRQERIVIKPVAGKGMKRLTPADIVATAPHYRQRLHRASRRAQRVLTSADRAKLKPGELACLDAELTALATVHLFSSARAQKTIAGCVNTTGHELPFRAVAKLFAEPPTAQEKTG